MLCELYWRVTCMLYVCLFVLVREERARINVIWYDNAALLSQRLLVSLRPSSPSEKRLLRARKSKVHIDYRSKCTIKEKAWPNLLRGTFQECSHDWTKRMRPSPPRKRDYIRTRRDLGLLFGDFFQEQQHSQRFSLEELRALR